MFFVFILFYIVFFLFSLQYHCACTPLPVGHSFEGRDDYEGEYLLWFCLKMNHKIES